VPEVVALAGPKRLEETIAVVERALGLRKRFLVVNWAAVNVAMGLPCEARDSTTKS
jgi:hypothetical protein